MPAYPTIDDAPSETLPEKLELLAARDVTAVFFCEGRRLDEHAAHAVAAVEAGHLLGNHADTHTHASDLSVGAFREEVARTDALLDDVYERAGVERPARLFRFPYGDRGDEHADDFQEVLEEEGFVGPDATAFAYDWYDDEHAGYRDWGWTLDVADWEVETPEAMRENVAAESERLASEPNDLLLFHDGGNTVAAFEAYLDALDAHGVALGDPRDLL
ncbi:hypothetical protein GCM10009037_23830 [Halarchaeum grantii]|uniref:NodB homology domain-containing protein n=1 Tax=Halarchaeum grantii TaxID=1193105 RepID=A0A830FBX6_9EURY|nr:polysaccharide deacetylase family protein [Halarchaeum grantii]GGL39319.1 hypothetical protein GCM10009037_23830 [Halarchaeum grantii]